MSNWIPVLDPDRLRAAGAALGGAFVYGVFHVVTLLLAGQRVTLGQLGRAGLNVLAAMLCAVVTAYFLAPVIAQVIPWSSLRDLRAVGFAIGALGWEVLPFVLQGAKNRARREAERQGGGPAGEGGAR